MRCALLISFFGLAALDLRPTPTKADGIILKGCRGEDRGATFKSWVWPLLYDFEAEFLDYWIGQDVLGYAFDLLLGFPRFQPVQRQNEKLALSHVLYFGISQRR